MVYLILITYRNVYRKRMPLDLMHSVRKSGNHKKPSFDPARLSLLTLCVFSVGVNVFLRKIAVAAASRPSVEIEQQGETLSIQTSTSVRTTHVSFTVGQIFNETTVDGRPCTVNLVVLHESF